MTQLEKLQVRLGPESNGKGLLLELLLESARDFILGYTNREEEQWLSFFDSVQLEIAIIKYNREGVEGTSSRSEGGVSSSYGSGSADYPDSIIKPLKARRLIKGISSPEVQP